MPDDGLHTPVARVHPARLLDLQIALVACIFGVVALGTILAEIHVRIPGTGIVTDPREVFVLLGAAITGPAGGFLIGLLASLGDPNAQQIPYIAANHILGAMWVGWAYRRLVFERFRMPAMAAGWLAIVFTYYYVCSLPVVAVTRAVFPTYFLTIVPYETSLWHTLYTMYAGWTPEFILTGAFTTIALAALPGSLRRPIWGEPRGLALLPPAATHGRNSQLLGLRLTVWFILLSFLPLIVLGIYLRSNLSQAFIDQVVHHDLEIVRAFAADARMSDESSAYAVATQSLHSEYHTAFLLDSLGRYLSHSDSSRNGLDARVDYFPTLIRRILRQREGYVIDDATGDAFVFAPLNGTSLVAVIVTSTRDALAALREVETSSLVRLAAALLVISGIAGVVIWLLVGRPLRVLAEAAQRIGQGDLEARVETRLMEDEVAGLAAAFNDMARDLGELNRGLKEQIQRHENLVRALQQSEMKFRETTDLLPQPIFESDLQGRLTFANKAAFQVFGYSQEILRERPPLTNMVAPEDRARVLQAIPEVISRGVAVGVEFRMLRADGARFPTLVYSAPILHEGKPVGIRGIVLDISERKREEDLIRTRAESSVQRQKALLELAQGAESEYHEQLRKITATASRVLKAGRVGYWRFVDEETGIECVDLFLAATGQHISGAKLQRSDFPRYFDALERYRSIDAHDAPTDERTSEFRDVYLSPNGITSMLDSVVWRAGRKIGVICIEHVGPQRIWSPEEIQFAASLADQISLAIETQERKQMQETLFDSETRFRTIIEQFADGFVLVDSDGRIIECNHAQEQISGLTRAEMLGKPVWEVSSLATPPLARSEPATRKLRAIVLSALSDRSSSVFANPREFPYVRADGTTGFLQQVLFPIHFKEGSRIGAVSRDVTERRLAEERIRASLAEKELLLKEIHHRVKNNLQVISSLLSLQSGSIRDSQDLALFRESENRIRSMALIHEKLYQSGDFSRVDFRQYLESLVGYLFRSYRVADVGSELEIEDIHLGINAAIPCGLILNELLTNALKHAFPGGRGGRIFVGLRKTNGDRACLTVRDSGVGLPPGFVPEKAQSLGLHLIRILATQLDGTLTYRNDGGAVFEMEFPIDSGTILTSKREGAR